MCCYKDNLVQAQENNTNDVHEMDYKLWTAMLQMKASTLELII